MSTRSSPPPRADLWSRRREVPLSVPLRKVCERTNGKNQSGPAAYPDVKYADGDAAARTRQAVRTRTLSDTVQGRKSGLPRTVLMVIWEHHGKRYVGSVHSLVDWVRNLRAAKEAILTQRRRSETVHVIELLPKEAALVLREDIQRGNPFARS